jgi:hypothetical protein
VVSFSHVSPPKSCIHLSSPPHVLHAPPTPFFSIWSHKQYLVPLLEEKYMKSFKITCKYQSLRHLKTKQTDLPRLLLRLRYFTQWAML